LLILDIDYFKQVNDRFGHNIGDVVLQEVAALLKGEIREIDIVCRWGGEEFVVLLPTASIEQAVVIAEKLRNKIASLEIEVVGNISASFGVAEVDKKIFLEDLIAKADEALYKAKSTGRNKVVAYKEV
jgi:diguanylate cyclase